VGEIFNTLANEEEKHIDILEEQYGHLMRLGKLKAVERDEKPMDISSVVITEKVQQEVSAAGYEAAAISAAMALEEQAVKFYSEHANSTDDMTAKELYQWLANWEKTHLTFLSELDRELMESIWYDNKFWPVI
jgi:rubrerythrin